MESIFALFQEFSIGRTALGLHALVLLLNLTIIFFATPFLSIFNKGKDISSQSRILRSGALLFLLLQVVDILLVSTFPAYEHYFVRIGFTLATIFGCLILFNITSFLSRQKFGYQKTIDESVVYLDSYNSRLLDLLTGILTIFIAVYCIVNIWEWDGLLQTTGLLGIIFGSMALSNGVWFPDVYFGLVILNSNMLEDGDVIKLDGFEDEHVISRVSFVYTILLDIRNNHRVLIRNSQLVQRRIDNLSKRASADGLRHSLSFQIGYPAVEQCGTESNSTQKSENNGREGNYNIYRNRIKAMFAAANVIVVEDKEAKINRNLPFEVALVSSGDYALTFKLNYYLETIPNTKVTKTIRQYLVRTPSLIQEAVNLTAINQGVVLATPVLIDHKNRALDQQMLLPGN